MRLLANDGSVKIGTEIDESGLKTGLSKLSSTAEKTFSGVGSAVTKGLSAMAKATTATFSAIQVGVTSVLGYAIKSGMDFEQQMSRVKAISGATGEEFAKLKEQAIELGASTAFSATEAAQGMENLASAGFSTSEIMDAMPGMLDLAASSGEDLASSADIAASTLRGFGLEASQAGHVADVLAKNAANTNAAVKDTGEAMKYVAPVAHTMGLSLEEVAASIGIMADSGIKGSQAGTTLRGALSRLAKPTEKMYQIMDELGLSFYDSNGKMKSLTEMVAMLQSNMSGLTDEQKQNALVTLFGQEALSGMMVLMDAGPDKLASLTDAYKNCDGAAAEMAATMMDNLAGAVEEMSGAAETFGLVLYENMQEPLKNLAVEATNSIRELTKAFQDGGLQGLAQAAGSVLTEWVGRFTQALPQFVQIGISVFQSLVSGLTQNSGTLGASVAQVATTLATGFMQIYPQFIQLGAQLILSILQGLQQNADQLGMQAGTLVTSLVQTFASYAPQILLAGVNIATSFLTGFAQSITNGNFASNGQQIITSLMSGISLALPQLVASAAQILYTIGTGIIMALPTLLTVASQILVSLVTQITSQIPLLAPVAVGILAAIVNGIAINLPQLIPCAVSLVASLVQNLLAQLPQIVSAGLNLLQGLVTGIVSSLPILTNAALQIASTFVANLASNLPQIISAGMQMLESLTQGILNMIPALASQLPIIVNTFVSVILENLPLIFDQGTEMIMSLIDGFLRCLPDITQAVIDLIRGFLDTIVEKLPTIVEHGVEMVMNLIAGLIQALPDLVGAALDIAMAFLDKIKEVDWVGLGGDILRGIANGVLGAIGNVIDAAKEAAGKILGAFKGLFGINSPSTVMRDEIGKWLLPGAEVGIEMTEGDFVDTAVKSAEDAIAAMQKVNPAQFVAKMKMQTYDNTSSMQGKIPMPEEVRRQGNTNAIDYDRFANAVANAISGMGIRVDRREFGRIVQEVAMA